MNKRTLTVGTLSLIRAWTGGNSDADEPAFNELAFDEVDSLNGAEDDGFSELVAGAIDELPSELQDAISGLPVVIRDFGAGSHAYGIYNGDGVGRDNVADRIIIFRDTLTRDFGHDPEVLAREVRRTLRHEFAHHLGWNERGVGGLGL